MRIGAEGIGNCGFIRLESVGIDLHEAADTVTQISDGGARCFAVAFSDAVRDGTRTHDRDFVQGRQLSADHQRQDRHEGNRAAYRQAAIRQGNSCRRGR